MEKKKSADLKNSDKERDIFSENIQFISTTQTHVSQNL